MNNDIYNNKSGSSLQDAYARLNEAIKIRNASAKGQQYDNANGVALNTTPIVNNASQGQQVQQQQSTPVTDDNIAIRTAGTVEQALRNIKSGFLNLGEGVFDAHVALAGIVNKEWAEEAIKFDISDTITEWMDNNLSANALYKSKTGNNLYDQSWLNDADEKIQNIVMGVEQGIGNALGFMALSSVPYVGVALTWEGSSGMALEEAINDPYYNGDYYGAAGSAILQGGVETGLEYLLGWNPKKMGVSTKTFKTVVKELGKNFAEEGLEEVASDLITPLFNGMYTDKTLAENYKDVTLESLGETFLVGGITGALMTGAGEVASAAYLSPEGQRIAHDIKENEEYYQQAYEKFKNNPNEAQALEEFNKVKEEVYNNLTALGQRITKLNSKYQNRLGNGIIIDGKTYTVGEQVQGKAKIIRAIDPRVKAIGETYELISDSGIKELADYTIEFTTDPNINGSFDSTNKKITINLNTQKAAKFILGHEITHAFENNTAYKKVYDEIVASLKEDGTYEELYNKAKKLYKKQIKNKTEAEARKYLEEEIVADYMGNNFKNFAEIQKLFTKQSTWEKFKDMIKGIRKDNRSSKAKEYYQRFLKESYGTKVEEKKQPKPALAGIKYSVDEANEIANTSKQIQKQVQKARDFVKDNKQYQEDPIKALKQQVDSYIQNINHTKKGSKDISKDARSVLVNFRGDKFLQNEFIADTITPDQKNYLETIFSFLEKRINNLNYSKRKTIPVLDYETKIDNMDGYEEYHEVFEGKTEGDLVLSALRVINKILNNANNDTVKLNGKELNRKTATQEEVERQRNYGRTEQKSAKGILKLIKQAGSSVLDGASYFDILANCDDKSLLNEIYLELYNSYLNKLKVAREYQEDINKFIKDKSNKKFLKKLKDEKSRVEIGGVKVLYGEAISLYMALDAKNAPEHLLKADRGGAVITNEKGQRSTIEQKAFMAMLTEEQRNKLADKSIKGKERKDLYKECGKTIKAEIGKVIENDASELIRILRKYYDKSGTLYQQTAQEHNGFSFPVQEEGTYYPLKTDLASFNKQSGTLDTTGNFMNDTMNPSFTKSLSGNVSNAIQISDVLETYVHFSEQLATWSQISVKIKQIDRFLNTTVSIPNQQRGIKFREYINQYIDPDFKKRYESLVKSMQGINRTEKTTVDRILNKTRGINASVSLAFNAKTIAIQPSAYFKFWHYVSPKNWLKAFGSNKGLKDFKWLLEHSALVYDRYFGNQGQNVAEAQTVGAASSLNAIGKAGMWGITQTDKLPLMLGWKAVQLEAQEKGITDETEILSMFEKAMYETQATHDALSNGSAVRVDNEIAKSFLMFSSENRKTLSRFFHSLYALKVNPKSKKAWREFSASTTSMVASAAFIAAISSILKRLKGDDEDEFIEMYGKEFGANMVGVFPIISNLYNTIVNGYDLQLTGFSQITDLLDLPKYCEKLMATDSTEAERTSAIVQIAQRLSHLVGIPFRNIYNDIMYIAGLGDFAFNTEMVLKLKNLYYNTNNSSLTTLAKTYSKRGDKDKVSAVIQIKSKNYGAGEISDKISNEFARLYMNGSMESFPSQLQDEYTVEGTLVKMNKEEYKHAQSVYELANEQMELMMATSQYLGLTDEEKAIAIKKLYSAYYDVAKSDTIGVEGTKFSKVSKYIDTGKYASYLAKIQSMKANTLTNKKEAVQAYVNRTNLSKAEKYLLAYLAGYSIADDGKTQVAAYLRSKGMSYKDSKTFTGIK